MQDRISFSLGHLSDKALLAGLVELTRSQWTLTATIVAHLAEVDARKLYLTQATSSLFAYCRERLGFSEDEACRRVDAARLAQKYPAIYAKLEHGEISLSVLGRLKPVISEKNAEELLSAVSGKSVRDAERILAARFPKPDVPDSIRKLPERKPAPPLVPAQAGVAPMATMPIGVTMRDGDPPQPEAPARVELTRTPERAPDRGCLQPLSADRIQVKFTASRVLEEKLELARDLMSHSNPSMDLATVIEAALDLLIAKCMKTKLGQTTRPRKSRPTKGERVTNAARREVVARDGLQCSFVDEEGRRCSSRAFLELDHREPKAKGGGRDAPNVRLLCREHNQGEAERVFGKEHMDRCRKKRNLEVRDGATVRHEHGFRAQPATVAVTRKDNVGDTQVHLVGTT